MSKAPLPKNFNKKLNNLDEIEKMKYEKVSYRQKGKNKAGLLVKGNVSSSYVKTANPSVPSKFETQLFDNNQENKGFGSKSIRFFDFISEDPGPGSYTNDDVLSTLGKTKQSHSKKGFGNGFISKVERFPSEIDYRAYFLPGPGAYASSLPSTRDESEIQLSAKKPKNDLPSYAFKSSGRTEKKTKNMVPGPGSYYVEKPMKRSLSQSNPSSVFKSGVEKHLILRPKNEGPPIGHYDVNNDLVLSKAESTFNILKNTSNF